MLKRARLAVPLEGRGEGDVERTIPPGTCWVMEGRLWTTFVWRQDGERHAADVPVRRYDALKRGGDVVFEALGMGHVRASAPSLGIAV